MLKLTIFTKQKPNTELLIKEAVVKFFFIVLLLCHLRILSGRLFENVIFESKA